MAESSFPGARGAAASFSWSLLGIGGQGLVRLLTLVVLARLVLPEHFGSFALASAIIGFVPMTIYTALRLCLIRGFAERASLGGITLILASVLGTCSLIVVFAVSHLIENAMAALGLAAVLKVMTCILLFDALAIVPEAYLVARGRFKTLGLIEFWSAVIGGALVAITLAWLFSANLWALAAGAVTQSGLRCMLVWSLSRERIVLKPSWKALGIISRFGAGLAVTHVANYTALQADTFVVGHTLGTGALGIYGRAYQLMAVPATTLGAVIDRVLYPTLCRARDHKRFFRREMLRVTRSLAATLLPMAACLMVIAPEVVGLLLGSSWTPAIAPFQFLVAVLYFRAAYKVGDCAIRAMGHVYNAAVRHWIYAGLVFVGATVGSMWGLQGVAVGIGAAILANWFSLLSLAARLAGIAARDLFVSHVPAIVLTVFVGGLTHVIVSFVRLKWDSELAIVASGLFTFATTVMCVEAAQRLTGKTLFALVGTRLTAARRS